MINSSADWLSAIIRWERLQDKEKEMKEWRLQKVEGVFYLRFGIQKWEGWLISSFTSLYSVIVLDYILLEGFWPRPLFIVGYSMFNIIIKYIRKYLID